MLIDDGSATVALPEVPLLGVLPGTGGLTRLVDKRFVRRDRADVFCTGEEGMKGAKALAWNLVDELVPMSSFAERVTERATEIAAMSDRPHDAAGVELTPLDRTITENRITYSSLVLDIDRVAGVVTVTVQGPEAEVPSSAEAATGQGANSGRCAWRGSWMTPSCTCASTSWSSGRSRSTRTARSKP